MNLHKMKIMLNLNEIFDIEIDGINREDYPDLCDAHICRAFYREPSGKTRELIDEELDKLHQDHWDWVYEQVWRSIH